MLEKIKNTMSDLAQSLISIRGDKRAFSYSYNDRYAFIIFPWRNYLEISSDKDAIFENLDQVPEFKGKEILLISGKDLRLGKNRWFSKTVL